MTHVRRSLLWPAMILAGLALGAYVVAAWPDTSSHVVRLPYGESMPKTPASEPVRVLASAEVDPESELSGVAAAFYPVELFDYELSPAPLLDAVIAAPQPADAH